MKEYKVSTVFQLLKNKPLTSLYKIKHQIRKEKKKKQI